MTIAGVGKAVAKSIAASKGIDGTVFDTVTGYQGNFPAGISAEKGHENGQPCLKEEVNTERRGETARIRVLKILSNRHNAKEMYSVKS